VTEENLLPNWPDETEEVAPREPSATESGNIAELAASSLADDEEDRRYVYIVGLLHQLSSDSSLALSDGVINHVVASTGIAVEGRTYWIYYRDSWGPEGGSFLQKGKNVAGVEARPVEGASGCWAVNHEELMRVLDSAIVESPKDERESEPAGER
jgi:hypothetical protein